MLHDILPFGHLGFGTESLHPRLLQKSAAEMTTPSQKMAPSRVTRLGEFSPIVRLFSWALFSKSHLCIAFLAVFPQKKL
jgi:hypothetical protein